MKRRVWVGFVAVLLACTLVFSCVGCGKKEAAQNGEETAQTGEEITLTFQQWFADECPEGLFQELVDGFTEETGIKIELLNAPNAETKTTLLAGAANGTIADIVGTDGKWVYDLVEGGALTPLDELFESCDVDTAQFSDMWVYEGSTYAMPIVTFSYPLVVNLDILEACGIKELPETQSEFLECCRIITEKGYNAYAWNFNTSNPAGLDHIFLNMFWESGGKMRDDDGLFQLADNEEFRQTAEYFKEFVDNGYVYPGYATMTEPDVTSLFGSGELAFCNPSLSMVSTWEIDNPNLNFTVIPMVKADDYTGTNYADYACWGIGISENCEHKEEAMQFINYMFSAEVNAKLAEGKGCFPGSTLAEPDYSDQSENFQKAYEIWQAHTPRAEFNATVETTVLRSGILENIVLYLLGDITVDEMMENCQAVCDEVYQQ
jgi:multiple sugar transport system substrate-binding protein